MRISDWSSDVCSSDLSVAAAIIVTRVSKSQDMGRQVIGQVFGQPRALSVAAVVLGVMGVIPGMPNLAFLLLGGICGGAAWQIGRAHVCTPVTNAHLVCRLLLAKITTLNTSTLI